MQGFKLLRFTCYVCVVCVCMWYVWYVWYVCVCGMYVCVYVVCVCMWYVCVCVCVVVCVHVCLVEENVHKVNQCKGMVGVYVCEGEGYIPMDLINSSYSS